MAEPTTTYFLSDEMRSGIAATTGCHNTCMEAVSYSLRQGGELAAQGHVLLLMDCADVCRTAADVLLRGTTMQMRVCALCADVCDICADHCARFKDDGFMRACVDACRECAKACRQIAGSAA